MGNCMGCITEEEQKKSEAFKPKVPTQENLILRANHRNVKDYYEIIETLGEGSMGSVSCVRKKIEAVGGSAYTVKKKAFFGLGERILRKKVPSHVIDGSSDKLYALKSIILSRISDEFITELRNEVSILQSLNHPNIVKAYEVYESKVNLYVVLEHCSGGDLYSRIPYSEKQSAKIVGKLLSAIAYMHSRNISHRDIKFENIMFESDHPDAEIKLIDFGLSKAYSPEKKFMNEGVGTIYTMAPQVLRGVYTSQADLWSIGVVTYMLLSNTKPFYGKKRRTVVNKILKGDFKFYSKNWKNTSEESKNFVRALIKVDSKLRLNANAALKHRWLDQQFPLSDRAPEQTTWDSVHQSIKAYGEVSQFKKMALMVVAHQSTTDEIRELRKCFDAYDTENNGIISFEEFKNAMQNAETRYTDEEVAELFQSVDSSNENKISYLDFLAATLEVHGRITEERLADAFDRLDSDDSGHISRENLRQMLGKEYSREKVDKLLEEVDMDGDGRISFDEFLKFFRMDNKKDARSLIPEFGDSIGVDEMSEIENMSEYTSERTGMSEAVSS